MKSMFQILVLKLNKMFICMYNTLTTPHHYLSGSGGVLFYLGLYISTYLLSYDYKITNVIF